MRRAARVLLALLLLLPIPASAKSARELPYAAERVWPVLVRFLRVDEKLKLVEKDPTAGYVLFELADGKRTFHGAAELAKVEGAQGRAGARVTVRLEDRPSYMEEGILERLVQKVREELGEPAPIVKPAPAPPPSPDAPTEDRKEVPK